MNFGVSIVFFCINSNERNNLKKLTKISVAMQTEKIQIKKPKYWPNNIPALKGLKNGGNGNEKIVIKMINIQKTIIIAI
jgi:hypothetical protein